MKMILSNFTRELLGLRYESILKSLVACVILFTALRSFTEALPISFGVFVLTITAFIFSIAYRLLGSDNLQKNMKGQFMLPFVNWQFNVSLFLASSIYAMLTKASTVMALYLAVTPLEKYPKMVGGFLLAGVGACGSAMVVRTLTQMEGCMKKLIFPAAIAVAQIFLCLIAHQSSTLYFAGQTVFLMVLLFFLLSEEPYYLLRPSPVVAGRYGDSGYRKNVSMFAYFFRYMVSHKNYILNTVIMWFAGCFLALLFGEFGDEGFAEVFMPLGLAVLAVNTPLGILVSSDKSLHKKIELLPNQRKVLLLPYGIFVLLSTAISYTIFLVSWRVLNGPFQLFYVLCAVLFAAQNALLTVLLEQKFPIVNWFVETDLWHNPRKYVAPGILMLQGVLIAGAVSLIS